MESTIWTEKYRPQTFDEVKGQQDIVKRVESFVEQGNMPHLMFSGPAGVGKTTLALVIAKRLFTENWRSNFLELNASDERGIDIVRVKVKDFARTRAIGDVPFKIIYLDECDALTKEAQQALRRTMENYTKTCRFILSCNYSSKIIDPIQSRCAVFKFKLLPKEEIEKLIMEKLLFKEFIIEPVDGLNEILEALYEVSNMGDMRRVMNILQSCASIAETSADTVTTAGNNKIITADLIYSMGSVAKPNEIKEILNYAVNQNFQSARKKLLDTMLNYGLSGLDIIKQISKSAWELPISNRKKVQLINKCGDIEFHLVEGSDEYIQLEALLAYIMMISNLEKEE